MNELKLKRGIGCWAAVASVFALAGCHKAPPAPQAPPPASVTVAHPAEKEVVEWDIFTGHLEAPESVSVAARVSGLITETPFAEGSIVKKGDLLAVIDDRPFRADVDAKVADEQKAEAQKAIAQLTFDRLNGLLSTKAVSQQDVDNAKANLDQAQAALGSAQAASETAKLNLSWCRVLCPIDGRVSNKLVTVGNLVNGGAGQATVLTTIESVTPMYCYVDVDENSVLKYQRLAAQGKLANARDGKVPCYAQLGNETGFPHEGVIDFVDNHVDVATGTQRVRGVFSNASGRLTPGFFARLSIPGSDRHTTLLVPDSAIGADQNSKNVLVVGDDNKVEPRPVKLGPLFGSLRSIVSGLTVNDRVIIDGQMRARPGASVAPTERAIKIDAGALSGPGGSAANTTPTTQSDSMDGSSSPATMPSGQSASEPAP